ncbi:hypothetical protein LPB03_12075 [Polaribacter vadi]|uniref:ABC-type uncharacterized transport system domain-containing protein n=2 Tax=Polaribacter vadi TaxID=1774273 RepID=A0A1B8TT65_9FLAO|nr:hypothetical protein LPB03_12075 [Polaribacter vadi]OBY62873.1 hypothetical protein LPB3_12090 [Polaribacter vadi]
MVAAVITTAIMVLINFIGNLWQDVPYINDIVYWLYLNHKSSEIVSGLISTQSVSYFLIITGVFIAVTIIRLSNKKKGKSKLRNLLEYSVVLLLATGLASFSSNPYNIKFYDMTRGKHKTLNKEIQAITSQLKEHPLKITFYVNILDIYTAGSGLPKHYNKNYRVFHQFTRFLPQLELEYVHFYDTIPPKSQVYRDNPGLFGKPLAKKMAAAYGLDFENILNPAEIKKMVDLSAEENRYVTQVSYNGKKEFLRLYNPPGTYPSVENIAAAFKKLTTKAPKVGVVTGHDECTLSKGDEGYNQVLSSREDDSSLSNNGFKFEYVAVDTNDIPEDIDILLIADPKSTYTATGLKRIANYIAEGKNLLVLAELENRKYLAPIVNPLGIHFVPGKITTQKNVNLVDTHIKGLVSAESVSRFKERGWERRVNSRIGFTMPMTGAVGMSYNNEGGFEKWNLLVTRKEVSIEKLATEKGSLSMPNLSENPISLAVGLDRMVGNKQQRIMIVGDSEFISNGERLYNGNQYNSGRSIGPRIFKWLANDEFPISSRHKTSSEDHTLNLNRTGLSWLMLIYMVLIPGVLTVIAVVFLGRRKGK